jgi:two-component system chemotaxis response regulator CheV
MALRPLQEDLVLKVGTNQMELLEFQIERQEEDGTVYTGRYGINVAKVLEVIQMPELTEVPASEPYVLGIMNLRGTTIPLLSLAKWMKIQEPERNPASNKVIITEFNGVRIGFIVHQASRIRRVAWKEIQIPPEIINEKYGGSITGTITLEDKRLLLLIDLEKIVADMSPGQEAALELPPPPKAERKKRSILVADDSLVARKQILKVLSHGNFEVDVVVNGQQAWDRMQAYYERSREEGLPLRDLVHLVLSDVEMPEMDGYTLTKKIKDDERFRQIPVVLHSSLSGETNVDKANRVGCNAYVVKFDPELLFQAVNSF